MQAFSLRFPNSKLVNLLECRLERRVGCLSKADARFVEAIDGKWHFRACREIAEFGHLVL